MPRPQGRRPQIVVAATVGLVASMAATMPGSAAPAAPIEPLAATSENVLLFAADGLRQDIVERYAADRGVPGFADLLRRGTAANGGGMLTQAPPNTGAGWYTMATGAWPGVHGSTNNTFHVNSQPFANRAAAFDPGVLTAETIAQAPNARASGSSRWSGPAVALASSTVPPSTSGRSSPAAV
jgi:predicted AlkP superfamily pyrophosphatase or phosphodiesterase